MTILVGLISKTAAAIASDGRRIAPDGSIESDTAVKVFRCTSAPYIYAIAGQLAPDRRELSDVLDAVLACYVRGKLLDAVAAIEREIRDVLRCAPENVVCWAARRATIMIGGLDGETPNIARVAAAPEGTDIVASRALAAPGCWTVAGDEPAWQAVRIELSKGAQLFGLNLGAAELASQAETAVQTGIAHSGRAWSGVLACGGLVRSVIIER